MHAICGNSKHFQPDERETGESQHEKPPLTAWLTRQGET